MNLPDESRAWGWRRRPFVADGEVTQSDDPELFARILGKAVRALEAEDVPYCVFGSIASAVHGRPNASGDIDLLVRPEDARRTLRALQHAGFATEETDPMWIFKARLEGVLVDVIFKVKGGIYLDDEVLAHTAPVDYQGERIRLISPEDAMLVEAMSTEDQAPSHWYNALGILAAGNLDWDYVQHRARYGPRRVLALLAFAHSDDYVVPEGVIRAVFEAAYAK